MSTGITVQKREPYPRGLFRNGKSLTFSAAFHEIGLNGLCLLGRDKALLIVLNDNFRTGHIYSAVFENVPVYYDSYVLLENDRFFTDSYARQVVQTDCRLLREATSVLIDDDNLTVLQVESPHPNTTEDDILPVDSCTADDIIYAGKIMNHNSFSSESPTLGPRIPYVSSFIYCLNVRGYTMQDKSIAKRNERGTFRGLIQKIPYLKELGVTAVELMPIFEPDCIHAAKDYQNDPYSDLDVISKPSNIQKCPNLWGFQDGFYFAVRSDYATDKASPGTEFLHTVNAFHAAGMEVILQFWFSPDCEKNLIMDCLRFYVSSYQIDGIHLKCDNISEDFILSDPLFSDIKILTKNRTDSWGGKMTPAYYGEDFMWRARHFLKGDDLSILPFIESAFTGVTMAPEIHFISNYDGFTLRDLVTYEHKRNEDNGEHSEDGRNDNISWNCGFEGETRKKQIVNLRKRQMLNALSFVFLSLGTPLLFAGDESGNTQNGNNNPYCQDNPVGWTDYDSKGKYSFVTTYVRFLAKLRVCLTGKTSAFKSLRNNSAKLIPDLSFHGVEAWKPDYGNTSHSIGVMFVTSQEDRVFVVFNMYWEDILFALPGSSTDGQWFVLSDTSKDNPVYPNPLHVSNNKLLVKARSVMICKSQPVEGSHNTKKPLSRNVISSAKDNSAKKN